MSENKEKGRHIGFLVFGAILIGLGVLFLVANTFSLLSIEKLWPLFLLVPPAILAAVWMQAGYKAHGVILPIIILVFFCLYFLWLNFTSWSNAATTWPNFILAPGLGFLGLFIVSRKWEFLIPSFILLLLTAIFYAAIIENTLVVGLLLIAMGIVLILRPFLMKKTTGGTPSASS